MSDSKMREDFEAWACSHEVYEDDGERLPMARLSGCYYEHLQTQAAWEAWQASREALAAQRDEGLEREAELREALRIAETYVQTAFSRAQQKDKLGRKLPADHPISADLSRVLAALASPGCADGEKAS